MGCVGELDLDQPRYDQTTYWGRAQHYFHTTSPANLFVSTERLHQYKLLLDQHRAGDLPGVGREELWRARTVCQSAFHPDTGDLMFLPGRMAAQVGAGWSVLSPPDCCPRSLVTWSLQAA